MLEIFPKVTILVHSGCYNKALQFGWLKQQKLIFPQFCKLESEIKLSAGLVSPMLSPWLVNGHLLHVSSHCYELRLVRNQVHSFPSRTLTSQGAAPL